MRALFAALSRCPHCGEKPAGPDGPCLPCLARSWQAVRDGDVISLGTYVGPLGSLIRAAKFAGAERAVDHLAAPLARGLAEAVAAEAALERAVLVPVPSHPSRVRQRGSDLPLRLAQALARLNTQHRVARAVVRPRPAPPQSRLLRRDRHTHVHAAFETPARWHSRLRGRRCVIVDDVITSGATVRAVADALALAGAEPSLVVAIARA